MYTYIHTYICDRNAHGRGALCELMVQLDVRVF